MYLVIYVRFPHMPVTGAGAVCIWSRHLCRSVPLLDQCSRDINCITAHYEGEGEVLGGTVPSNYYLHCSALARRCEVCSLARGTLETGIFDPLSRARTVIRAEESSGSRDEGI